MLYLSIAASLLASAMIRCPEVKDAPALKTVGQTCGGACNIEGDCAEGLKCVVPQASSLSFAILLGAPQRSGTCTVMEVEDELKAPPSKVEVAKVAKVEAKAEKVEKVEKVEQVEKAVAKEAVEKVEKVEKVVTKEEKDAKVEKLAVKDEKGRKLQEEVNGGKIPLGATEIPHKIPIFDPSTVPKEDSHRVKGGPSTAAVEESPHKIPMHPDHKVPMEPRKLAEKRELVGGGIEACPLDDVDMLRAAKEGVRIVQASSNSLDVLSVVQILRATKQVVAGVKYTITLELSDSALHRIEIVDTPWLTPRFSMLEHRVMSNDAI